MLIQSSRRLNFQAPGKHFECKPNEVMPAPEWIKETAMWELGRRGPNPAIKIIQSTLIDEDTNEPVAKKPTKPRATKAATAFDEATATGE